MWKSTIRITLALLLLAGGAFFIGSLLYTRMPATHQAAAELLDATANMRRDIEAHALEHNTLAGSATSLGFPATVHTAHAEASLSVTPDGVMVMRSSRPAFELTLAPTLGAGSVAWHCTGSPATGLPVFCRGASGR